MRIFVVVLGTSTEIGALSTMSLIYRSISVGLVHFLADMRAVLRHSKGSPRWLAKWLKSCPLGIENPLLHPFLHLEHTNINNRGNTLIQVITST